jgi:anti-anti-sigma factor
VDLVITEIASGRRTIVKLCGELDIASAPGLRERLLACLSRQTPNYLVLDLSELEFIDSSGIAVLVNTERRARLLGCALVLVAPQAPVSRVLQICGLNHHFLIFETIGALAGNGNLDSPGSLSLGLGPEAAESDPAAVRPSEQV